MTGSQPTPPKGWTAFYANLPSESQRTQWRDYQWSDPNHVAGLACGKVYDGENRIVCLDVDDDRLVRCLSYLFPSPCERFGSKGMALFYRVNRKTKSLSESTSFYAAGGSKAPLVEYMSVGKLLFIPPFKHRKTGKPYKWVNGISLPTVVSQLPELTAKDLRIIKAIVELDVEGGNITNILEGEGTHNPTVSLTAALVALGLEPERVEKAVGLLFPSGYAGNTIDQIHSMVESAMRKGFDKKSGPSTDPEDSDLPDLFTDWYYVESINRMVNGVTKDVLDQERFNFRFGKELKRAYSVYAQWSGNSIKNRLTYLPGKPPIMLDSVNMWRPTTIGPKQGDVSVWLDHIKNFYSVEAADHLLNWLAYTLQHQSTKPGHAVLMGSKYEGIGKDLWLIPVREAFGKHNVSEIGADALSSQFNEWLAHKHLIIVQEIWTGARRELSNQLKPLLSSPPDEIMVNEKGIARYPVPNVCATIMLTNHKDAVSMAAEDRRYFVMWSEAAPQSPEYYQHFADWVSDEENHARVYDYLLRRDVSKFNIKAPPPKTDAKAEMVDATMTRSENLVVVIRDIFQEIGLKDVVAEAPLYEQLKNISPDIARDVIKVPRSSPRYPIRLALKMLGYEAMKEKAFKKVAGKVHFVNVYCQTAKMEEYESKRPVDLYDLVQHPTEY